MKLKHNDACSQSRKGDGPQRRGPRAPVLLVLLWAAATLAAPGPEGGRPADGPQKEPLKKAKGVAAEQTKETIAGKAQQTPAENVKEAGVRKAEQGSREAPDGRPLQPAGEKETADHEVREREHKINEDQSVDSYTSLEDAQPGEPGSWEYIFPLGGTRSKHGYPALRFAPEFGYTLDGNSTLIRGTQLAFSVEMERSRMPAVRSFAADDLASLAIGRASVDGQPPLLLTDYPFYSAARHLFDPYADPVARRLAYYQMGRAVATPAPTYSLDQLIQVEAVRWLLDKEARQPIQSANRVPKNGNAWQNESALNLLWLQRWVNDHGRESWVPTVGTLAEVSVPLTDAPDRGLRGTLTLTGTKYFGPGSVFINGFCSSVAGNQDPDLRGFGCGQRLGYKWQLPDGHHALLVTGVHEQSEDHRAGEENRIEASFEIYREGMIIGPGISYGKDRNERRYGFGLTITFG